MDKIKEKVSNWLSYFKDHIQSFNVIAREKNFVYFSKFTLESEEFFQIHNFVLTLKYNIIHDLFEQFKYCVYNIISFGDKNLSERDKIMTIYSACFLNYFKKFLYNTKHEFEEFYDNSFFNLIKTFNVEIKNMEIFKVLSFCFFKKMKEEITKLNYETKIKPLKQSYNPKIENDEQKTNNIDNNNIQNEKNIKNNINEEGIGVKNKAINYVVSAKEKIVDIIYEIKYRKFLPNILPNDEISTINNALNRFNNMSGQMLDNLSKTLEKEKLKTNDLFEKNEINMSLNDDKTSDEINESFNTSINLNLNQSFNKVSEISNSDNFKNNMDFISNINNKIINSNDINNINNFNMNIKNNNINKINFINTDNKLHNQNSINEIKMNKEEFNNINNNNLNNNIKSKSAFKPNNIIINAQQNKNNMYSHRLIDELIRNKIDDKTMEIIINVAKKIDEKYLDYLLNHSPKPILILDYFSCYVANFTSKMLQDIDPDNAEALGNVNIKFIILAKELYNTAMELFCSIYDLTSTNINRFLDLAKNCGIHVQYTQGLYKLFKDYSIFLLEKNAFRDLRKTVNNFIEMERLNWEKVINSQTNNISSF